MSPHALSEVEAYEYIRRQLRELGWIVKNPSLGTGGQVWTQNQCLSHPRIKQALGQARPENIVKVTERFLWVIEGKAAQKDIGKAVDEALNDYAKPINDLDCEIEAVLASGVAGDEDSGYLVKTFVRLDKQWHPVTINGQESTGLLTPADASFLLDHQSTVRKTRWSCLTRPIEDLFIVHRAKSGTLTQYESGPVPYLANGFSHGGVAAYVTPRIGDTVFNFRALVVSAFGETMIQMPPFVAYGAAGTSLIVLEPRTVVTNAELVYLAAWLRNALHGRFNWYYRCIPDRLKRFVLPKLIPSEEAFSVKPLLPPIGSDLGGQSPFELVPFRIDELFKVHRARSRGFDDHDSGDVAFVSNGNGTGVVGFVEPLAGERVFGFRGIVLSAMSGATVQAPPFIARGSGGSGLVVLEPRESMTAAELLCVASYYNCSVRWRFNWYRQISVDQVRPLVVHVPGVDGKADPDTAKAIATAVPYWSYVESQMA